MRRLTTMLREVRWSDRARRLARWQNPLVASPGAPFETVAALDALGPSLMPRTSRLAGMANAMAVPGEFGSFGHDYRADMVRFVQDAYRFPAASEQQLDRIEQMLVSLELDRAERIKAQRAHLAPPAPAHRDAGMDAVAGVPLRTRRTRGARWLRRRRAEVLPP
jgi:hypothetical protein